MKQVLLGVLMCIGLSSAKADIPWQTIYTGSAYWTDVFGLPSTGVQPIILKINSPTVSTYADPSVQLLNAVLRHHIDALPNKSMITFADSMMHVLTYLSGAHPTAKTVNNRAGWWSLPYPVALRYGLKVNKEKDERYDFERSTYAAMNYCQDLYDQFGSDLWMYAFIYSSLNASCVFASIYQFIFLFILFISYQL